ncbi:hypothetical protein L1987_13462 [Smallanthus sonchifolius]|uniref:Uncharacterized protein n=1 Tax=Smallanthus sonchifolius TaxID=185202 RepID=A0ACB9JHI0_9ASTR|nr:hypothetical protein L1987_13462 [Smallanthus sonchifolius]
MKGQIHGLGRDILQTLKNQANSSLRTLGRTPVIIRYQTNMRYQVPFEALESTSPFWNSIKRTSAYIIVLSSYSAYVDIVFSGDAHAYEPQEKKLP